LGVRKKIWTFQGAHEADIVPSVWHMPFVLWHLMEVTDYCWSDRIIWKPTERNGITAEWMPYIN
jgi:hypothetical protein